MICTETYLRRVSREDEPGEAYSVLWEARLIRQHLYDAGSVSGKFVPVLLASGSPDHVPTAVKGGTIYRVESSEGYDGLYRLLTNQPPVRKPELGKLRQLADRQRVSLGEPPTGTVTGTGRSSRQIKFLSCSANRFRRSAPSPELADLQVFRDALSAPEMVVIPAGKFWMGSQEAMSRPSERPQHQVVILRPNDGKYGTVEKAPSCSDRTRLRCDCERSEVTWGR
jgi:hypothetical protein